MLQVERAYLLLLEKGVSPQIARSVLPNSLKTEVVVTANLREWRHIFNLRCASTAHPQMRQIMLPLLVRMRFLVPFFEDTFEGIIKELIPTPIGRVYLMEEYYGKNLLPRQKVQKELTLQV